jgi:cation diffusion facilitator family transporter
MTRSARASGSVALLSDAVHNAGDALTAIPLAAEFLLGRRPPAARLTDGYGRAIDLAGLAVLAIMFISAGYAAYEAIDRLIHPSTPSYLLAVGLAGAIGFAGNEWVAVCRIRTGRRIGSAALVADGHHARIDGFTSLAVVAGAIGVALGFQLADPLVGLAISIVILRIVWSSAREIGLRMPDGIEPDVIRDIRHEASHVSGVESVRGVRARWVGHEIRADIRVVAPGSLTLEEAHAFVHAMRVRVRGRVSHLGEALIQVEPSSDSSGGVGATK